MSEIKNIPIDVTFGDVVKRSVIKKLKKVAIFLFAVVFNIAFFAGIFFLFQEEIMHFISNWTKGDTIFTFIGITVFRIVGIKGIIFFAIYIVMNST